MADAFFTRAPSTIVTIPLTGQLEFTIPFEFLARKFVVVTLLGTDRKVLTLGTDYRFIAVNKLQLARQPDGDYTRIELRRYTSATDRLVTFIDGSILRATDLNLAQVQTMHVAEEARDLTSDNIGVNDDGDLDARNRKIVNLADAENPLDAVNLGQLRQFDTSTGSNADRAERSAANAKDSADNASNSEARCIVAEAKAIASAGTSITAAADANRSKTKAESAATTAGEILVKVEAASGPSVELVNKVSSLEGNYNNLSQDLTSVEAEVSSLKVTVGTNSNEISGIKARVDSLEKKPAFCSISHIGLQAFLEVSTATYPYLWSLGSGGSVSIVDGTVNNEDFQLFYDDGWPRVVIKKAGLYEIRYEQFSGAAPLKDRRLFISKTSGTNTLEVLSTTGTPLAAGPSGCSAIFSAQIGSEYRIGSTNNYYYAGSGNNRLTIRRIQ